MCALALSAECLSIDLLHFMRFHFFWLILSEPITQFGGVLVYMSMALTIVVAFHWIGAVDEELIDEYGREYADSIMFNGEIRNTIGGLPDYIFATMIWYLLAIVVGIIAALQWNVDVQETRSGKQHVASESTHNPTASGSMNGATTETAKETEMATTGPAV